MYLIYILVFVVGTVFASFIHLYATRLMNDESIVLPRSHCPKCNHVLGPLELIPIVSYIIQGGRCKKCNSRIGLDSLAVEILTGALFILTFAIYGFSYKTLLGFTLVLVAIAVFITDFKNMIILDSTIFGGSLIAYIFIVLDKGLWEGLYKSLLYGVFAFVLMFLVKVIGDAVFKRESLGGGDIKFAFLMGSVLPYDLFLVALVIASMSALPYALYISASKKTHELPFGPFLAVGLLVTFLCQNSIGEVLKILVG